MVEIRSLRPTVTIRMPTRKAKGFRASQFKVVRRTQETHPTPTPQPTPCRLWQGAGGSDGYGWRKVDGKPMSMHRWVMSQVIGRKLRSTEVVLHACDNPLCYRVDHLSIGTVKSNNDDMRAKGRATPPPVNVFHGEAHPMAKLQAWQVRKIRGHFQSGLAVKTIAEMFEISPSTVRRIVKGQTWAVGSDRDLLSEARAKITEAGAQLAASQAQQQAAPERIRPVKPIIKRRNRP